MRLKSFHAKSMGEAMELVRSALGDDAIIVSTQRGGGHQGGADHRRAGIRRCRPCRRRDAGGKRRFGRRGLDRRAALTAHGYTGEDGFELIVPAARAAEIWKALEAAGVKPIGLGARDTLRLEAGMNLYGSDMDETKNPLESGLAWTVDFTEGRDFIGRAALEAYDRSKQLVGLLLEDRGVLRGHMRVVTPHGEGETTSGSFAPSMNASIAFARVPAAVQLGDTVEVDIRGKLLKARVTKLSFVRNGKVLA